MHRNRPAREQPAQARRHVVWLLVTLATACAARPAGRPGPGAEPAPEHPAAPPAADGTEGVLVTNPGASPSGEPAPEVPPGGYPEKPAPPAPRGGSCTVKDSNGPLAGGEQITSGCARDEICVCDRAAGYSCAGQCRPRGTVGEVGGTKVH